MDIFTINKETCTKCGICAEVCIMSVIDYIPDNFPKPFSHVEKSCIRCGACVVSCPSESVIHRDISIDDCPKTDENISVSFTQISNLVKTRRSVRVFKDQTVSRDDIERILEVVRFSPTGSNMQNVEWLVFDDKENLNQLSEMGSDWLIDEFVNNQMYANLVDQDWKDNLLKRKEAGTLDFLKSAPVVISAVSDTDRPESKYTTCAIALAYFDIVATTMGLGCCWHGLFTRAATYHSKMVEIINLPEGKQIFGSLLVGYPRYNYARIPKRNPAKISWHTNI